MKYSCTYTECTQDAIIEYRWSLPNGKAASAYTCAQHIMTEELLSEAKKESPLATLKIIYL